MDDEQYSGAFLPVASFATSVNAPLASTLPRWISWMAYPTQLRTSLAPCRSQVLDDSVISTRTYCVVTGVSGKLSVTVPPFAFLNEPLGITFHVPAGPRSKSSASFPSQYSTR